MGFNSVYESTKCLVGLPMTTISANGVTNGTAIDLQQVHEDYRNAEVIIFTGTLTDGSYTIAVQESPDGTTAWTAVPAARLEGTTTPITSAQDNVVVEIGVSPDPYNKRFLRVVITAASVTTGGAVAALWLLAAGSNMPVVRP